MANTPTLVRIGIFGVDVSSTNQINRHTDLWQIGHAGSLTHIEATPVDLCSPNANRTWDDILEEIDGVVFAGFPANQPHNRTHEEDLCHWCREHKMPLLAIDNGMLALNTAFGGTLYNDMPRELPEALQHRHPPEEDVRHIIEIVPKTLLEKIYGEGEVIVNSLHRGSIQRLARGFNVSGRSLDGVIEAVEWEDDDWFALGIQWQPSSATSSGLDIQVFRALVDRTRELVEQSTPHSDQREWARAA